MYRSLFILVALLLGCGNDAAGPVTHLRGVAMTVPYHVAIGQPLQRSQMRDVQALIDRTFDEIDLTYNKWNRRSEISRLNQAPANQKIALSAPLHLFFLDVGRLVKLTNGYFDPSVEPIQQLWKNAFKRGVPPTEGAIAAALTHVGWHHLHFDENGVVKNDARIALDLGGVAKGYAIDLIAERLVQAGYGNVYVEWGGDIAAKGLHPDNRPWQVLVTKWGVPGDEQTVVELKDMAIASSGDYLQNWRIGDIVYTHIFNPATGKPLEISARAICSVTICCSNCMLADTIATTAMLFKNKREALIWLEKLKTRYPELRYWVYER